MRGAKPHWRPVSVESLTPLVRKFLVVAGDDDTELLIVSVAEVVAVVLAGRNW